VESTFPCKQKRVSVQRIGEDNAVVGVRLCTVSRVKDSRGLIGA